jgi:hypothetical protein
VSAIISPCGQYRYRLEREGDMVESYFADPLPFIMLNPSTADATLDDPTIRRCRAFAKALGYAGIVVVNLYALRSTDPTKLWQHADPVGPDNDTWLIDAAHRSPEIVCAWGANARPDRVAYVAEILKSAGARLRCLGTTKDGAPRHPLYVGGDQPLIDWSPA